MKASLITVIAALASSAMAAPAGSLSDVSILKEATSTTNSIPAVSPVPSSGASGHIVQDVGHSVNQVLTVTGTDGKKLLIELSPKIAGLLSGLGLPGVGVSVGEVVKTAASVGDVIKGLGSAVDGLLTVVGKDGGALLIKLSPDIAGLLSSVGLPGVGIPVGSTVATLGENLKRSADGQLVQDVAPEVQDVLEVTGTDSKRILIKLSPSVASLLAGLGLPRVGNSAGQIIKTASNAGDLIKDVGEPVKNLLTVVAQDGSFLLIRLSPNVAGLLASLSLPALGTAVGSVVATLGANL
ncbi:hypothetical protein BDV40DRAFT_310139 [Aspergillus tamarii]|uniref:Hydrophobic surface binding protein A-domain-containing protein n=1 Tax=Aspergillus tamarii TaxID=41984 RepID=A0A5N6VC92_ASPTM|nr:hypothetical protein BDV40DRAFT_310139 [Aspergillus tamarii]